MVLARTSEVNTEREGQSTRKEMSKGKQKQMVENPEKRQEAQEGKLEPVVHHQENWEQLLSEHFESTCEFMKRHTMPWTTLAILNTSEHLQVAPGFPDDEKWEHSTELSLCELDVPKMGQNFLSQNVVLLHFGVDIHLLQSAKTPATSQYLEYGHGFPDVLPSKWL
ncbi:hypothetical protein BDV93DRAFT_506426 [Ceratobasidium sp. AG-I]|nr:hypothetical protein BDV93DRAFT_506426 [Ceratobasidium sp. AG-I]